MVVDATARAGSSSGRRSARKPQAVCIAMVLVSMWQVWQVGPALDPSLDLPMTPCLEVDHVPVRVIEAHVTGLGGTQYHLDLAGGCLVHMAPHSLHAHAVAVHSFEAAGWLLDLVTQASPCSTPTMDCGWCAHVAGVGTGGRAATRCPPRSPPCSVGAYRC